MGVLSNLIIFVKLLYRLSNCATLSRQNIDVYGADFNVVQKNSGVLFAGCC